jgi:hypothetical protein
MKLVACVVAVALVASPAVARPHHRHHFVTHERGSYLAGNGRPGAWCGWFMRQLKGVADTSYNLAANWAHYGHATSAHPGAVVVWRHHVGEIVAGNCGPGQAMVHSGNDGNAVKTRCLSIRGAIAFRE